MDILNLILVAGKILNTGGKALFQEMLRNGEEVAAKSFLLAVLYDRITTGYTPDKITFVDAAEYYNLLGLSPTSFPQGCNLA